MASARPFTRESLKNVTQLIHLLAVGYFYVFTSLVIWLEVVEVVPVVFDQGYHFMVGLYLYISLNVFLNHLYLMTTNVSCKDVTYSPGQQMEKDGYYYCQICEQESPARAHHCGFCGTCVARRDHHCFVIANCIGLANLRFFIVFNIFICAGCALALANNYYYLDIYLGPFSNNTNWINLLLPYSLYKWWTNDLGGILVVAIVTTYLCLFKVFVSFGIACYYLLLVLKGQTLYERKHGVLQYSKGRYTNMQDVCSKRWFLWFVPVIFQRTKLYLKGNEYSSKSYVKPMKNV